MAINTPETVSTPGAMSTGAKDETPNVGNGKFLLAIFGDDLGDARPVVVSFEGNPASAPDEAWSVTAWQSASGRSPSVPDSANNYFSLATFRPDGAGQFRRRNEHFYALYAFMLDDIGSKVAAERLTLPPSWLLETSAGNHQAGYLLSEPLADGLVADRVMNAIAAAGLSDPGAKGPRTRLARLPIAVNTKHEPPFACRMVKWAPAVRYSVEELVDGFQLDMAPARQPHTRLMQDRPGEDDPVWIPRPEDNAVLAALRSCGLYKAPLGDGKHDITCPWVREHTDEVDGGTAYFEPDDQWPIGGFKCFHGHCAERHIFDLLDFLEIEVNAARIQPTIQVIAGEMPRIVDAAERALAQSRSHYQRGGLIVTAVTDPDTCETRVQPLSQPALVHALASVADWERFNAHSQVRTRIDPPARHARVLFESANYLHLPVLGGLARQPCIRLDGTVVTAPGYDAATRLFGVFDAREYTISEHPTRAQAKAALALLEGLLTEFCFTRPAAQAAALAALLTAAVRPSLAHAPMFHVRATMAGAGKSYLCTLLTAFATPQQSTPTTFPGDDEECGKLLLAELLDAKAVIDFDNLTSDLIPHRSLCMALTSAHMSGRILGLSKTATVSTRALFLSSGTNVGPVRDMTRRCITVHLDPGCEVPAARNFKRPELVRDVLRERGRFVSAALTLVTAWIVAGRPVSDCRPLAGFDEWSDLCRQPLLWLGLPDPAESMFEAMADDPDRNTLARLLEAWESVFGNTPAMVREAVKRSSTCPDKHADLHEVLHDIAGERGDINRLKLGRWIKRHEGQIVDGRRFVRGDGNRSAQAWRVESVSSVSSGSSVNNVNSPADDGNAYIRSGHGE